MTTECVDIICETESQVNEALARLNDSGFVWSDDTELFEDEDVLEEIREEVKEWNVFLRVNANGHVSWNVIGYREEDEDIPMIHAHDYLTQIAENDMISTYNINKRSTIDIGKPDYYTDSKYQPFDVIEDWGLGFCLGNVLKYIKRAGKKKSGTLTDKEKEIEDLKKCIVYINRRIYQIENGIMID